MGLLSNYSRTVGTMTPRSGSSYRPGPTAMSRLTSYNAPQQVESRNYAVPSRIAPVNLLDQWTQAGAGVLGEAMALPGRIVEAPFSLLNNVIRGLTGDWFGGKGIDVAEGIGKSPVGSIFKGAGDLIDTVSNVPSALINSQDTDLIQKYRGKGDDFEIPDFGEITEGGILGAIPGIGGFFGRQKTLGELKDELRSRGFTDQDFSDIQTGKRSVFDYGDKMTNDNLLIGLGTRIATDPTNLLFMVPGANLAKIGQFGTRVGGLLRGVATTARRGDAAFDLAKAEGRLPDPIPSASLLVRDTVRGHPTRVLPGVQQLADDMVRNFNRRGVDFRTLATAAGLARAGAGTAKFLLDPKGYQTRVGFYKRAAAIYGTELAITALPDGILDGLQNFAQESLDKQPMSNNTAFMLGAAMTIPIREFATEMPKYWQASMTQTFDNTILPSFEKKFGMSLDAAANAVGGRRIIEKQIMASTINLMREKGIDLSKPLKAAIESFQERGDTSIDIGRNLNVMMHAHLRTGKLRGDEIVDQMISDFKNASSLRGETIVLPDGRKVELPDLMTQLPFDPQMWVSRTKDYAQALQLVEDSFHGKNPMNLAGRVTIGLRNTYTKEQLNDIIIPAAKALDEGGSIPLHEVRSFLTANQILFRMSTREELARYLADFPDDAVPTSTLVTLLEQARDNQGTPTNADYYWKDEDYQRNAILAQPDGPMQHKLENISRKIHSTLNPDGTIKKGQNKKYNTLRTKLQREVAWRVQRGEQMGEASPRTVATALRAEAARIEATLDPGVTTPFLDDLRQSIRYFDNRAKGSSGTKSMPAWVKEYDLQVAEKFPSPKLDEAILKHVPEWYLDEMRALTDDVWALSKEYTVTLAPKDSYIARPEDTLPEAMLKQRNLVGRILYDHSIFGAPARIMDFLLKPVGSSAMLADAEQAIMNEYIGAGAKPDEVRQFLASLREEAIDKHAVSVNRGYRIYGSVKAVLPQDVNRIAAKVWGGAESSVQRRIGQGNHHRVIDRAGSRILRDLKERNNVRRPDRAKLGQLVNDKFWNAFEDVQYTLKSSGVTKSGRDIPIASSVLTGSRIMGNTLYHLFRFILDPRYWLMNHFEHVVIGTVRDGLGNKTNGMQSPAFNRVSGVGEGLRPDPADVIAAAGEGGGAKPSYLVDAAETGMFHGNRAVTARIAKTFDAERPESTFRVLEDMEQTDPALVKLRRDFGAGDNRQLAEILDEQWFNFDQKGVAKTVKQEYAELFANEPQTAQTMAESALIVQRITDANQALYDDLVKTYLGNPNRNTLERVLNSYWLFWPLSYQLKASKWLVRALTQQAFGRDTNALGLYQYGQLREYFTDQLTNNEEFALQFDGQEHLWQTAAMFFPITPEDVGVSLSRPVRTFGSMFFPDWFEPTFGTRDPIAGLAYTFEIGPLYTARLLRSLSATIFPEGTDLSIIEPQVPDLDMEQFAQMFPTQYNVQTVGQ